MVRLGGRVWRLLFLIMVFTLLSGVLSVQAVAEADKTYIEFIFDASFSMNENVEKNKSRMDVAKEVMIELVQNLEDRPGLEVGLRVYGSRNTDCDDSVLVQDFGSVDAVRGNILDVVRSLKPRGKTPIAYSLEQAAQDFPSRDSRNIIVLITDGQESCGGDPCAVSYYLQSQGIFYKPYVVGFAMSRSEEARVSCIGTYYSAKDRKSLSEALASIIRKVVEPSQLEIEAWAGGQNVTSQTVFEIEDASGDLVGTRQRPEGDIFRKVLAEGTYAVTGTLQAGSTVLEATQSGITLGEGESKRVRLDFGDLLANLEVEVTYRGTNITSDTRLEINRLGAKEAAFGTGSKLFRHEGAAGEVDLRVTYVGDINVDKEVTGVTLTQGKTTRVTVDLDDILGTLRVKVKAGDGDVTSRAEVTAEDGQHKLSLGLRGDYLVATIPANLYGVRAIYQQSKSSLAEVTVKAGEVTDVTLEVDVPGRIVLVPMIGDKPVALRKVNAWVYHTPGQGTSFDVQDDRLVTTVEAGVYDIRGVYKGVPEQVRELRDVEVRSGETKEVKVTFQPVGKLRIKLTDDGKPFDRSDPRLRLYLGSEDFDSAAYLADLEKMEKGIYELELQEGSYDLRILHLGEGFSDKTLYDFKVKGGATTEETIEVGDSGTLRITLTSGGKPHKEGRVNVYRPKDSDSPGYVDCLKNLESGVYELKLKEGIYDLELVNLGDGFRNQKLYGIEVIGGSTTEKTIELGGEGTLRINLTSGGKPHKEGRVNVYWPKDSDSPGYVDCLKNLERGVYELKLKKGIYDLWIGNLGDGFADQNLYGIEVIAGGTTAKTIELGGEGTLRINLTSGGKPHKEGRVNVYWPKDSDSPGYVDCLKNLERGVYELKLKEGIYDLWIGNLGDGFADQNLYGIEVIGGSTTEKTIEVGGE